MDAGEWGGDAGKDLSGDRAAGTGSVAEILRAKNALRMTRSFYNATDGCKNHQGMVAMEPWGPTARAPPEG